MIALVLMPFVPLEHPSLGISLVKSVLQADGISSELHYANLEFAQELGPLLSTVLKQVPNDLLLGEWLFAKAAFANAPSPEEDYLQTLSDCVEPALWPRLLEARELAVTFVADLAEKLMTKGLRILGCSSMFSQNCATLALLKRIKALDPSVVTVMGGSNCESTMGRALVDNFSCVDFVLSGESEEVVADLFRGLIQHGRSLEPLPPGVLARGRGATDRLILQELDKSPLPDFSDYFSTLERLPLGRQMKPGLLVETSRGCWWGQTSHCTFCGLNGHGMNYRSKSPARAIEEYAWLAQRHQIYKFEAVDNILDRSYFETVLPAFEGAGYEIFYEVKANLKKTEVEALARAGVRWLQPGLESLHIGPLKLMRKGTTPTINLALLKWAREQGIWIVWNILCGFPGEEERWYGEMADLVPLVSHLQPPQGLTQLRFDRYSPYYTQAEEYDLKLVPSPAYRHVYPLDEQALDELAYYFVDANQDSGRFRRGEYSRLRQALADWSAEFKRGVPAVLSAEDDGQELRIFDTRRVAPSRQRTLRGLAREVLLECDQPSSPKKLARQMQRSWEELESTVTMLSQERLLLWRDDRLLALPVFGSLPGLPSPCEFPGGHYAYQAAEVAL
jgi:ribosomal peptide maturation radical SAM protein 1